jgi:AcrR family transcriptional regulator
VSALPAETEGAGRTAPRSRKGARTRARLLDAAKQIFEEHGFLEARISDIADRAGLSHGAFYHYFDSKEQVFREVAESLDDQLSEPMETVIFAPGSTASPRERIFTAVHRHLERYRDEARIMRVIEEVARYDEHVFAVRAARNARHREEIATSIRRMQRRRLADPALDPEIAAAALGSMVERFAEMWLAQGQLDADLDAAADVLAALFANALGLAQ